MLDGKRHGHGEMGCVSLAFRSTQRMHWRRDPAGTCTYGPGESVYRGAWQHGKRHGQGYMLLPDGSEYEGAWDAGQMRGQGRRKWPDGREYTGEFLDGELSGRGSMVYPDGGRYDGEWCSSAWHGRGVSVASDGTQHTGTFQRHKAHGPGEITRPDGTVITATFVSGQVDGGALIRYPDGSVYSGDLHSLQRSGFGVLGAADAVLEQVGCDDAPLVLTAGVAAAESSVAVSESGFAEGKEGADADSSEAGAEGCDAAPHAASSAESELSSSSPATVAAGAACGGSGEEVASDGSEGGATVPTFRPSTAWSPPTTPSAGLVYSGEWVNDAPVALGTVLRGGWGPHLPPIPTAAEAAEAAAAAPKTPKTPKTPKKKGKKGASGADAALDPSIDWETATAAAVPQPASVPQIRAGHALPGLCLAAVYAPPGAKEAYETAEAESAAQAAAEQAAAEAEEEVAAAATPKGKGKKKALSVKAEAAAAEAAAAEELEVALAAGLPHAWRRATWQAWEQLALGEQGRLLSISLQSAQARESGETEWCDCPEWLLVASSWPQGLESGSHLNPQAAEAAFQAQVQTLAEDISAARSAEAATSPKSRRSPRSKASKAEAPAEAPEVEAARALQRGTAEAARAASVPWLVTPVRADVSSEPRSPPVEDAHAQGVLSPPLQDGILQLPAGALALSKAAQGDLRLVVRDATPFHPHDTYALPPCYMPLHALPAVEEEEATPAPASPTKAGRRKK